MGCSGSSPSEPNALDQRDATITQGDAEPKDTDKPDGGKPDSGRPDNGKPDGGKPDGAKPIGPATDSGLHNDAGERDGGPTVPAIDLCPDNLDKDAPGICGCSESDWDEDEDGTPDCLDACPTDPGKTTPGACGCGVDDEDVASCAQDIDECLVDHGGCDPLVTCTNSAGSHGCGECPVGYSGSGDASCVDIDECALGAVAVCGEGATDCENGIATFSCTCADGYVGTGTQACVVAQVSACGESGSYEPIEPQGDETCYDLPVHGVSAPDDTTPFTVPASESYNQFYFDIPWAAGSVASRFEVVLDHEEVSVHAWLFEVQPNYADGTVVANTTGTTILDQSRLLAAWQVGGCRVEMPQDVGLYLPSPGINRSLMVQWHHAAPTPQADAGRFRVCTVSASARAHVAGVSLLGTESVNIPAGMSRSFTGTCLNQSGAPITLLAVGPHMHLSGTHARLDVERSGGATELLHDQPFDFNYQVHYPIPRTVLQPGDWLRATCSYENNTASQISFGQSTQQEQCFHFAYSYPAGALDNHVVSLIGPSNTCWQPGE